MWLRKAADQNYEHSQVRLRAMGEFSPKPDTAPPRFHTSR